MVRGAVGEGKAVRGLSERQTKNGISANDYWPFLKI
jgi:hypothetical protein